MFTRTLVIMPLDHPLKWTADYQLQTIIQLVEHNNTVLAYHAYEKQSKMYNFWRKKQDEEKWLGLVHFFPFHPLPFERFTAIYSFNVRLSFLLSLLKVRILFRPKGKIILWIFHPRFFWMVGIAKKVFGRRVVVLYDNLDYFSFPSLEEEKRIRAGEHFLLQNADLVTTISHSLLQVHRQTRKKIFVVPSGFRQKEFAKIRTFRTHFHSSAIIGFSGAINYRIDFDLVYEFCKRNPQFLFVFLGPISTDASDRNLLKAKIKKLFLLPNVTHIEYEKPAEIPKIMQNWDIGIIPYDLKIQFNQYCNPLKVMEYFYLGLPVLSTPIPELLQYQKYIHFGSSVTEWESAVHQILKKGLNKKNQQETRQIAIKNSWKNKIEQIAQHLSDNLY